MDLSQIIAKYVKSVEVKLIKLILSLLDIQERQNFNHKSVRDVINVDRAINGDFQTICSLNTIQKSNSELKAAGDLDTDDVLDKMKMMNVPNRYVQTICK